MKTLTVIGTAISCAIALYLGHLHSNEVVSRVSHDRKSEIGNAYMAGQGSALHNAALCINGYMPTSNLLGALEEDRADYLKSIK